MICCNEQQVRSYAALKLTHALSVNAPLSTACLLSGVSARFVCSRFGDEANENSVLALNNLRDARQRRGSYCESEKGGKADVIRAASIATAALNRWRSGSVDADLVLSLGLARSSTLSPSTAISCLHDSALRLHSRSEDQKSLRCVLSTMGNCGRRRAATSNLNPHEEWLCGRLVSHDLCAVESANLTAYASLLFSSMQGELEAPLSWELCLENILPRALKNPTSYSASLGLAEICCAIPVARGVADGPFRLDCADMISDLLGKKHEARLNFECRNRAFMKCSAVLESLVVTVAPLSRKNVWRRVVVERECSWADALWLWIRGHGSYDDAHVWMEALDTVLQSPGPMHCISLCELVIVTCCMSTAPLFGAESRVGRLATVGSYIGKVVTQINSASYTAAEFELLWIAAVARQLPLLSHREHSRLRSNLFVHVLDNVGNGSYSPSHARVSLLLRTLSGQHLDGASDFRGRIGISAYDQ